MDKKIQIATDSEMQRLGRVRNFLNSRRGKVPEKQWLAAKKSLDELEAKMTAGAILPKNTRA